MTANLHAPPTHPAPGPADRAAAATPSWYPCTSAVNAAAGVARFYPRLHEMLVVRVMKRASKHKLLSDADFAVLQLQGPARGCHGNGTTSVAARAVRRASRELLIDRKRECRAYGARFLIHPSVPRAPCAQLTRGLNTAREAPEPVSLPTRILEVSGCARLLPFKRHPSSSVRTGRRALHTATLSRASNYTNGPPRP